MRQTAVLVAALFLMPLCAQAEEIANPHSGWIQSILEEILDGIKGAYGVLTDEADNATPMIVPTGSEITSATGNATPMIVPTGYQSEASEILETTFEVEAEVTPDG